MFFNLLTLSVPDVTPWCFSIFWLWAYLTLKSKDWKTSWSNVGYTQSQKIEKHPRVTSGTLKIKRLKNILESWRYSMMFFNLLTLSVPDVTPGCFSTYWLWAQVRSKSTDWKTSWSNVRYAQSQQIEKHPRVTSGTNLLTLNVPDVTPGCFFNLLTLSVPDVTPGCFSISFDFERTWCYSRMFKDWNTSWSNIRYAQCQKIEKHHGVTLGTLKIKRLKNITLNVPDVTPGCFFNRLTWVYLTLLQDVFQSVDFTALGKYCSLQSGLKFCETFFSLNQLLKKGVGVELIKVD
jgi:hypothetical protein